MNNASTKRSSGALPAIDRGQTDWVRVDALTDQDIQAAAAADPDIAPTTPLDWADARLVRSQGKEPVTLRLDRDVLTWFRRQGRGYQTRINAVLRAFVEAQHGGRR